MIYWTLWSSDDDWEEARERMLRETEQYLERALAAQIAAPRIPRVRVGMGAFDSRFAFRYWMHVLFGPSGT